MRIPYPIRRWFNMTFCFDFQYCDIGNGLLESRLFVYRFRPLAWVKRLWTYNYERYKDR